MLLKESKKMEMIEVGNNVRLSSRISNTQMFHTREGVIASVKGINGSCYEVSFTNGSLGYVSWSTKVELI